MHVVSSRGNYTVDESVPGGARAYGAAVTLSTR